MGGRSDFHFQFLQSTGVGTKTLTIPSVSDSFSWTAQQVAKLGNNKQAIYILALDELSCSLVSEVSIVVYAIGSLWATIGVPLNHNVGDIMVGGRGCQGNASSQYI